MKNWVFKLMSIYGVMVIVSDDKQDQELIVSPVGQEGDVNGWRQFLSTMSKVFSKYGDIPVVHFSSHERTWVGMYLIS